MEDAEYLLEMVRTKPASEVEWTLHNVSNAVLIDMLIVLLKLLETYRIKAAEYE